MSSVLGEPPYLSWPARDGYDMPAIHEAALKGIEVLRSWHAPGGADVTLFGDVSLGRLWRMDLLYPVMNMFRRVARGTDPHSELLWDYGLAEKYAPFLNDATVVRRSDARARAFRLFYRTVERLRPRGSRRPVLLMSSPSNIALRRFWLNHPSRPGIALDFPLSQPPGTIPALLSVLRGARVFDPAPAELDADERRAVEAVRRAAAELPRRGEWRMSFEFGGRNLSTAFAERLLPLFLNAIEPLAIKYKSFSRELDRLGPKLIILPNEAGVDSLIMIQAAKTRRVPTWLVNHGFPGAGYRFEENPSSGQLECDRILAWSPQDRDNYVAAGAAPERLTVTGNPAFDALLPAPAPTPFRGVRSATVLLVAHPTSAGTAAAYFDDAEERYFTDVVRLLDRLGAARVVYKLHPGSQRPDFYERLKSGLSVACEVELAKTEPFASVLARTDWAIGPISTAIFETLLSGKDYFFFSIDPIHSPRPFETKNSYIAKTVAELERNLTSGNPVPRGRILGEFLALNGGEDSTHATRAIFELIQTELTSRQGDRNE